MTRPPCIDPAQITGLVLAGGRGSRMGGVDKGLQSHLGQPLAWHALQRLRPQVGRLMLNVNRNLATYETFGVPVWPDADSDFAGPLAGVLAGLQHCTTPWLATVPCDCPNFPEDLVPRLSQGLIDDDAGVAMAATGLADSPRTQPVFMLLRRELADDLTQALASGERKVERWTARHRTRIVYFDDAAAFANANTPEELRQLQHPPCA
jgi:molybdopterin-guanine dinucleotide biosynthesis protein A